MSRTPAARLAKLKREHPCWSIERQEDRHITGYHAERHRDGAVETIDAASLTELEERLAEREGGQQ